MPPKPTAPKASTSKAATKKPATTADKPPYEDILSKAATSAKKLTPKEKEIYELGKSQKDALVTQEFLQDALHVDAMDTEIMNAIASLTKKRLFVGAQAKDGSLVWRVQTPVEAKSTGTVSDETAMVLGFIKESGDRGVWSKTLKAKSGLHQSVLTKCISQLEGLKKIKSVKSVKNPTRKMYMLEGLTPSIELTGGPWYTDNDLDTELIEGVSRLCRRSVVHLSVGDEKNVDKFFPVGHLPYLPTAYDVAKAIKEVRAVAVDLSPAHIETVLRLLVFDGELQEIRITRQEGDYDSEPEDNKKRKRSSGGGRKGKKAKIEGDDSDAIDNASEEESAAEIEEDDEDELPPPLDENGEALKNYKKRPGPPGRGKHYYVYRALARPICENPMKIGVTDTPCGVCPVRHECDNKEKPSMPERSLADVDSLVGTGVTVQRKRTRNEEDDEALIRLKPPNGMFEPPKQWMGGGTRGKQRVGAVNPRDCDYYTRWLDYS